MTPLHIQIESEIIHALAIAADIPELARAYQRAAAYIDADATPEATHRRLELALVRSGGAWVVSFADGVKLGRYSNAEARNALRNKLIQGR